MLRISFSIRHVMRIPLVSRPSGRMPSTG